MFYNKSNCLKDIYNNNRQSGKIWLKFCLKSRINKYKITAFICLIWTFCFKDKAN